MIIVLALSSFLQALAKHAFIICVIYIFCLPPGPGVGIQSGSRGRDRISGRWIVTRSVMIGAGVLCWCVNERGHDPWPRLAVSELHGPRSRLSPVIHMFLLE